MPIDEVTYSAQHNSKTEVYTSYELWHSGLSAGVPHVGRLTEIFIESFFMEGIQCLIFLTHTGRGSDTLPINSGMKHLGRLWKRGRRCACPSETKCRRVAMLALLFASRQKRQKKK
jgi:hypothetical protein